MVLQWTSSPAPVPVLSTKLFCMFSTIAINRNMITLFSEKAHRGLGEECHFVAYVRCWRYIQQSGSSEWAAYLRIYITSKQISWFQFLKRVCLCSSYAFCLLSTPNATDILNGMSPFLDVSFLLQGALPHSMWYMLHYTTSRKHTLMITLITNDLATIQHTWTHIFYIANLDHFMVTDECVAVQTVHREQR